MIELFIEGIPKPEPKKLGAYRYLSGGRRVIGTRKRDFDGSKGRWHNSVKIAGFLFHQKSDILPFPQYQALWAIFEFRVPRLVNHVHVYPVTGEDLDNYCYLATNALKKVCYHDDNQIACASQIKLYTDADHPTGLTISLVEFNSLSLKLWHTQIEQIKAGAMVSG